MRSLRGPPGTNLRGACEDAIQAFAEIPLVGHGLCWPEGLTLFFTGVPTYCEIPAKALTIGAAADTRSPCDQTYWETPWANTPRGVFALVGWMTLPTVLGLVLPPALGLRRALPSFLPTLTTLHHSIGRITHTTILMATILLGLKRSLPALHLG